MANRRERELALTQVVARFQGIDEYALQMLRIVESREVSDEGHHSSRAIKRTRVRMLKTKRHHRDTQRTLAIHGTGMAFRASRLESGLGFRV